jgi:membrane fusion protein, multidrug efflux system
MLTKKILLSLALSVSLLCCSTADIFAAKPGAAGETPPAIVEAQQIKYSKSQEEITTTGTLVAIPGVTIKPEASGIIVNVYFKSGDKVKTGDPLVEIYPDIAKAELAQNEAALKLAQLNFDRYTKLYAGKATSTSDYDSARANLTTAKAKVDQSRAALSQTVVKAPFDGRVGLSQVSLGKYIKAGEDKIANLQSLDPMYVDFAIPEVYTGKIKVDQTISLKSSAYGTEIFTGKITAIDPLINESTRTLSIRAMLPNKDERLLPGSFAEISVAIGEGKDIIKVPQTAVVLDPSGNYIYRIIDGKAVKTPITTGTRDADSFVINSGLKVGDMIVTVGQLKIAQDGAPVIVVPSEASK